MSRRKATRRLSARIDGDQLWVVIEGGGEERWPLPDEADSDAIRRLSTEARQWAADRHATYGQEKAIHKCLTDHGFFLTHARS